MRVAGSLARHHHVQKVGASGGQGFSNRPLQLLRLRYQLGLHTHPSRHLGESEHRTGEIHVWVGPIGWGVEALSIGVQIVLEDSILAVGEDDEQDVEFVMGCRPERLNAVHGRAISGQRHHGSIGMRHLDAQGAGYTLTDAATATRVVVTRSFEPEALGDVEHCRDGFVHDHGIFGQRAADLVHGTRGRHGCGVPEGLETGIECLPPGRSLLSQSLIAALAGSPEVGVRRRPDGRVQKCQGLAQVPDHAQRQREIVGEALRGFLDLDGDGAFGNGAHRVEPHLLEERTADQHHQVVLRQDLANGAGFEAHPAAQVGVAVGDGYLGPKPFEVHRGARLLGELGQRLVGTAGCDVVTGDDGRVLAGQNQLRPASR